MKYRNDPGGCANKAAMAAVAISLLLACSFAVLILIVFTVDLPEKRAMEHAASKDVGAAIASAPIDTRSAKDIMAYFRPLSNSDGQVKSRIVHTTILNSSIAGTTGDISMETLRAHYASDGSLATMPDGSAEILPDVVTLKMEVHDGNWHIVKVEGHP